MSVFEIALGVMIGRWLSDLVPFCLIGIASLVFPAPTPSDDE